MVRAMSSPRSNCPKPQEASEADTGAELPAGLKTARSASHRVVSSAPRSTSIYYRSFSTESRGSGHCFASTWTGHLHSLDPLGTRWSRLKRVTEILGLTDNLFIAKFHDTHRIRWLPIVSEDEFGHPEIGSTNNSPH